MQIGMIENSTRVVGKSQGYMGLPLRDIVEDGTPAMESVWFPTPKEMEAISLGAPVLLKVAGTMHPPVLLSVGEVPS
jgi:hypothetical protein